MIMMMMMMINVRVHDTKFSNTFLIRLKVRMFCNRKYHIIIGDDTSLEIGIMQSVSNENI